MYDRVTATAAPESSTGKKYAVLKKYPINPLVTRFTASASESASTSRMDTVMMTSKNVFLNEVNTRLSPESRTKLSKPTNSGGRKTLHS